MTGESIGGHDNEFGKMLVYRRDGHVEKVAYDEHNAAALRNEARMLVHLDGLGIAPGDLMVLSDDDALPFVIAQEDLGNTEPPTDGEALRRSVIGVLARMRSREVRHGDFTASNWIIRDNQIRVVDWAEAHLFGEPAPQKQPTSDSSLAMRAVADLGMDTPRVARRWRAVLHHLGAGTVTLPLRGMRFADYGCFEGDFPALAACEGMRALGYDRGGFRSGYDSIDAGVALWERVQKWPDLPPALVHADIIGLLDAPAPDVAVCFSTWPYLVHEYGRERAVAALARWIERSGVLFFETQLAGDGPGPDFLREDEDVRRLLSEAAAGYIEPLVTIPVTGRPAQRTVWAVRREASSAESTHLPVD